MTRHIQRLIISCIIIALASCVASERITNKFKLAIVEANHIEKDYTAITFAFAGEAVTRIFYDNLYAAMEPLLAKKGITVRKVFLGNNPDNITNKLQRFAGTEGRQAILLVRPQSEAAVTETNEEIIAVNIRSIKLKQDIIFSLYDNENFKKPVWRSVLYMDVNFVEKHINKKIAEKLFSEMVLNKIIRGCTV